MTSVLAIIPARGGSKGLPGKNLVMVRGRPMIAWSIQAALESRYVTDVVVSSDCEEILKVASNYGAEVLVRSAKLSTDEVSSEAVASAVLRQLMVQARHYHYVLLLQPTSPMRDAVEVDNAISKLAHTESVDALISVCTADNKMLKAFMLDDFGHLHGISNNEYPFMRRQDLPKTYMSNGAIYLCKVSWFLERESFYSDHTIPYVMEPEKSVDVDTYADVEYINRTF